MNWPAAPSNGFVSIQNLLKAKWWRATQFQEGSTFNDTAVLQFYENNSMTLGSKKI